MLKTKKVPSSGFTLIELMVVIAILIILAATSIPAIINALPNFRLRAASYDIVASIQRARAVAVEENRDVVVTIDAGGGVVNFPFQQGVATPVLLNAFGGTSFGTGLSTEDWAGTVAMPQATAITFNSRGLASGAGGNMTIYLDNGGGGGINQLCYGIRVLTTGFVQMRKYVPCAAGDATCWVD